MRTVTSFSAITLLWITLFFGCTRGLSDKQAGTDINGDFTVEKAKQWYEQTFQQSASWKEAWASSKKVPDWKNAIYKQMGGQEFLEFNLLTQNKRLMVPARSLNPSQVRQVVNASLTRAVFIRGADNRTLVREVNYIPDWQYLQQKNFDISKTCYGKPGDDFTGIMVVSDWRGTIIATRVVQDGKITKRISRASSANPAAKENPCDWVQYCMWYCNGSYSCSDPYMDPNDCYWQFECPDNDPDPCVLYGINCSGGGGDEGGGDNGDGGSSPSPVDQVTDQLTDPCKKTALTKITAPAIRNFVTGFYNNFLLPTGSTFNLVLKEANDLTVGGEPSRAYTVKTNDNTWEITLSSNFFTGPDFSMSQEAWGAVIIHEILHVAIQANNLAPTPNEDHARIFTTFVEPARDLLVEAFGMSSDNALKLALTGINDLWAYSDFEQICMDRYGVSTADITATYDSYIKGTGGTKCN